MLKSWEIWRLFKQGGISSDIFYKYEEYKYLIGRLEAIKQVGNNKRLD